MQSATETSTHVFFLDSGIFELGIFGPRRIDNEALRLKAFGPLKSEERGFKKTGTSVNFVS